jgi:hypothetical protein
LPVVIMVAEAHGRELIRQSTTPRGRGADDPAKIPHVPASCAGFTPP